MARIFNIYFAFEGMVYNAVVSVRTTPFFTEYTLNNFHEELIELLPGNKILSQSPGHFVFHEIFATREDFEARNNMPCAKEWFARLALHPGRGFVVLSARHQLAKLGPRRMSEPRLVFSKKQRSAGTISA